MYIKDSQPTALPNLAPPDTASSVADAEVERQETEKLPTMYDLPSQDPTKPRLPDEFHWLQPHLFSETYCPENYPSDRIFLAADLNLYHTQHGGDLQLIPDRALIGML